LKQVYHWSLLNSCTTS